MVGFSNVWNWIPEFRSRASASGLETLVEGGVAAGVGALWGHRVVKDCTAGQGALIGLVTAVSLNILLLLVSCITPKDLREKVMFWGFLPTAGASVFSASLLCHLTRLTSFQTALKVSLVSIGLPMLIVAHVLSIGVVRKAIEKRRQRNLQQS